MCFLFDISSMRYTIAIISNLPAIILMIRNIFDIIFMSKEVIPVGKSSCCYCRNRFKKQNPKDSFDQNNLIQLQ